MNIDREPGDHARSKLANIRGQNSRTKPADDRAGSIPASSASGSEVAPIAGKSGSMRVAARRGLRRLAGQRDWAGGCNAVSGPGDLHDEMPGSPAPADPGAGTTSRCWA